MSETVVNPSHLRALHGFLLRCGRHRILLEHIGSFERPIKAKTFFFFFGPCLFPSLRMVFRETYFVSGASQVFGLACCCGVLALVLAWD